MRNGNLLKSRISEICIKYTHVQGVGVNGWASNYICKKPIITFEPQNHHGSVSDCYTTQLLRCSGTSKKTVETCLYGELNMPPWFEQR